MLPVAACTDAWGSPVGASMARERSAGGIRILLSLGIAAVA
ncbi:MAG: hypothetical protein ACJAZO_004597, partial [Myxococcota bacterium]